MLPFSAMLENEHTSNNTVNTILTSFQIVHEIISCRRHFLMYHSGLIRKHVHEAGPRGRGAELHKHGWEEVWIVRLNGKSLL